MRVAYTCHDSFPSADTNTQQIFWTVAELSRLGVDIDLVIPSLATGAARDPRDAIAAHYGMPGGELPAGLAFRPAGTGTAAGPLAKAWFDWRISASLGEGAFDVVWTRDPLAVVSSVRRRLPVVFETYRPDFASAARFGPWRRACLGSPHLRGVVTHSRVAAAAFLAAGVPGEQCLIAHNGFAPSLMEPRLDRAEARARLGLPLNEALVVYTGHVGSEKGTDALVRIAAAVPHARMVIVGVEPGSREAAWLEARRSQAGAGNLLLVPRVPLAGVAAYLYAADCLIVPPTTTPLRAGRTVLPMKIFTYMAAGRAILAPRLPDVEEVLVDGRTACLVAPDDVPAAASALARLLGDGKLRGQLGRSAFEAASDYTWQARARRLRDFLSKLGQPRAAGGSDQREARRSPAAAAASSRA